MLTVYPSRIASQHALTRSYPPAAATNPVLSAVCWALGKAGVHPDEVGERPRHYPDPLRGARFFILLLLDTYMHACA